MQIGRNTYSKFVVPRTLWFVVVVPHWARILFVAVALNVCEKQQNKTKQWNC